MVVEEIYPRCQDILSVQIYKDHFDPFHEGIFVYQAECLIEGVTLLTVSSDVEIPFLELLLIFVHEYIEDLASHYPHGVLVKLLGVVEQDDSERKLLMMIEEVVDGLGLVSLEPALQAHPCVDITLQLLLTVLAFEFFDHDLRHLNQSEEVASDLDGVDPVELRIHMVGQLGQLVVLRVVPVVDQLTYTCQNH